MAFEALQELERMKGEMALRDLRDYMAAAHKEGRRFDAQALERLARDNMDIYKGIDSVRTIIKNLPRTADYSAAPAAPQWPGKDTSAENAALGSVQFADKNPKNAKDRVPTFNPMTYRDPRWGVDITFTGDDRKDYDTIGRIRSGGMNGALKFNAESMDKIEETNKFVNMLMNVDE